MKTRLAAFGFILLSLSNVNVSHSKEAIVIGATIGNPPFASLSDNKDHFIGFEIDIMNNICTKLDLSCSYKPVLASQILEALNSGSIDIAISAVIIPTTSDKNLVFSLPYLPSNAQFMTLKSSSIDSKSALIGKRIGVRRGTLDNGMFFANYIRAMYNNQITVVDYLTMPELISALSEHKVDAIFANMFSLNYWSNQTPNQYKMIGKPFPIGNGYGFLTTPKHVILTQKANTVLKSMMADGTYTLLYNNYFQKFQ